MVRQLLALDGNRGRTVGWIAKPSRVWSGNKSIFPLIWKSLSTPAPRHVPMHNVVKLSVSNPGIGYMLFSLITSNKKAGVVEMTDLLAWCLPVARLCAGRPSVWAT